MDGLTYSNFAYAIAGATAGNTNSLSIEIVSVTIVGSDIMIALNPNLTQNGSGQGIYDIHLAYEVTGGAEQGSLTNGGADSTIQETNCNTGVAETPTTCSTGSNIVFWQATAASVGGSSTDTCGPGTATTGTGNAVCTLGRHPESGVGVQRYRSRLHELGRNHPDQLRRSQHVLR